MWTPATTRVGVFLPFPLPRKDGGGGRKKKNGAGDLGVFIATHKEERAGKRPRIPRGVGNCSAISFCFLSGFFFFAYGFGIFGGLGGRFLLNMLPVL